MRKIIPIALVAIIAVIGIFLIVKNKSDGTAKNTAPETAGGRLLMNVLEIGKRPFVAMIPHSSGRLLTLYLDNVDSSIKSATIDIEYLSGNSLKGGRVSPSFPIKLPHSQGFLLGSCSTGGKCSFDTDLTAGNIKTRLDLTNGESHILKSDFIFINGSVNSPDGRVSYTPASPKVKNQILADTQGLPLLLDKPLAYAPLAISADGPTKIQAELKIKVASVTSALIFDGEKYIDLPFTFESEQVVISLNNSPWHKQVEITRDDQKGAKETAELYILGPIVLVK